MSPVIEQLREGRNRLAALVSRLCANDACLEPPPPHVAAQVTQHDTRAAAEKLRVMSARLHRLVW